MRDRPIFHVILDLGDTSVRRSSTGSVTCLALTHCHDATVLRPIET